MASPFSLFRKHSKNLMVVLVVMAMFAFTLDSLFSAGGTNFVLLGLLLGAGLSLIVGLASGKPLEYAVGGTVAGGLMGFLIPMMSSRQDVVFTTEFGNITQEKLNDMVDRRQVANEFVKRAWQITNEDAFRDGSRDFMFGFGHQMIGRDVLLGEALRREAEGLGISVDDEAVTEFIKQVSGDKLSLTQFTEVRNNIYYGGKRLSESDLYDVLRDEMQARLALQMLLPLRGNANPSPEQFWGLFKRLNVRQELTSVAVPVEEFVAGVPDPSDQEIAEFFESHKNEFPHSLEPGSPGFRQGRKLSLAYLEADYETIEASIPDITDEEIEKYYEDNKDEQFKEEYLPDDVPDTPAGSSNDDESVPESTDDAKPDNDGGEKKDGDADPEASSEATPDGNDSASKPDEPADSKPEDDATPEANSDNSDPSSEPEADNKPADEQPGADSNDAQAAVGTRQSALFSVADDEDGDASSAESSDNQPEDKASGDDKTPAAEANGTEAREDKDAPAEESAKPEGDAATSDDEAAPGDGPTIPPVPESASAESDDAAPPEKPPTRYRPLDDELRGRIRDTLLTERTQAEMESRILAAVGEMRRLADEFYAPPPSNDPEATRLKPEDMARELKAFADQKGLKYVETGLLSFAELSDAEEYPIGSATEPVESRFAQPDPQTVAQELFSSASGSSAFEPDQAIDLFNTENRFAFWVTDEQDPHVPTIDEPGVRDQVVEAWKTQVAGPLAEKRAGELKELAATAIADEKTMSDAFEEMTVTGEDGAAAISVRTTPPFSWMRRSTATQTNPFAGRQLELSAIIGVEGAGNDFMKAIFEDLGNNELGVVPNFDKSTYYLVQIRDRTPATDAELAGLRTRFMNERFFGFMSPFPGLVNSENVSLNSKWRERLEARYGIVQLAAAE